MSADGESVSDASSCKMNSAAAVAYSLSLSLALRLPFFTNTAATAAAAANERENIMDNIAVLLCAHVNIMRERERELMTPAKKK